MNSVDLFTPLKIKNIVLKNRVVLPPMVRFSIVGEDGYVNSSLISWYEKIAKSGVGLIIVEATAVSADGKLRKNQLGIWDDSFIPGLKKIVDICRKNRTPIFIQLHHAGFKDDIETVSKNKLDEILFQFIDASQRAKKCGFDGIELHAAHSYLISQLHSKLWNNRKDKYGDRLYFTKQLIRKTMSLFSDDFILGVRIGGNEPTLGDGIFIAKELEKMGVDLIHVSTGIPDPKFKQEQKVEIPSTFLFDWVVYLGIEIKKQIKIPVIAVRKIKTEQDASYLIENNLVDLVAIGRAIIAKPNWVSIAKKKYKIRQT